MIELPAPDKIPPLYMENMISIVKIPEMVENLHVIAEYSNISIVRIIIKNPVYLLNLFFIAAPAFSQELC